MPTQEELDQKAADYGFYVNKIQTLKEEEDKLRSSLQELTAAHEKHTQLQKDTQDATERLRSQLIDIEKEIEAAKKRKEEELKIDRSVSEAQRKANTEEAARLQILAGEHEKRSFALDSRERELKAQQTQVDSEKRALLDEKARVEKMLQEAKDTLALAHSKQRDNEKTKSEMETILRKNEDICAQAASSREQARADRLATEETAGKAKADLEDIRFHHEMVERKTLQLSALLPVYRELHDYVRSHVQDPDGIAAKVKDLFPDIADDLPQG